MIAALDVDYRPELAVVACVGFERWADAHAAFERTWRQDVHARPYEPGAFFRRELPCLLAAIRELPFAPAVAVIDGYVWLAPGRRGLGAHLHEALAGGVAVVGVAKGPFRGALEAIEVIRGESRRPLYVTAEGMNVREAADAVRDMHGTHRIPTLLKRVDRLSREG
ncbi:MAG: endonuclease V [Myxococcota bacterium]